VKTLCLRLQENPSAWSHLFHYIEAFSDASYASLAQEAGMEAVYQPT